MKCKYGQTGVCEKLFRPNCPDDSSCFEFEMFTNADRIRAMSDEEMVDAFCKTVGTTQFACCVCCDNNCKVLTTKECEALIMNWLRKPAKEEQHDT